MISGASTSFYLFCIIIIDFFGFFFVVLLFHWLFLILCVVSSTALQRSSRNFNAGFECKLTRQASRTQICDFKRDVTLQLKWAVVKLDCILCTGSCLLSHCPINVHYCNGLVRYVGCWNRLNGNICDVRRNHFDQHIDLVSIVNGESEHMWTGLVKVTLVALQLVKQDWRIFLFWFWFWLLKIYGVLVTRADIWISWDRSNNF